MSTSYDIACIDCKQKLWIGDRGAGNTEMRLTGDREEMEGFLKNHTLHNLKFLPEQEEQEEFEEFIKD